MPAKPSGEIKTATIRQKQKNGDVYVIERKTQYDPSKKYNVVLSSKIIGKIPKGEETVVPTRRKRKNGKKSLDQESDHPYLGTVLDFKKASRSYEAIGTREEAGYAEELSGQAEAACPDAAIDGLLDSAVAGVREAIYAMSKKAAEAAAKEQNIKTLLAAVKALTESTGWSTDEAMSALKVSVEDQSVLMERL